MGIKVHKIINKYIQRKKGSSSGFSIRGLAAKLHLSPSFLSRVLNGQKPLPYTLLVRLKPLIDIEDEVFLILKDSYNITTTNKKIRSPKEVQTSMQNWDLIEKKGYSILRQWFYLPILEFTTLKSYDGSLKSIADGLEISGTSVEIAVRELMTLGLMREENGFYYKTDKKVRWSSSKSMREIRLFHHQMMAKAQQELSEKTTESDFEKRLITGITLTASPEKIAEAKRKLAEALHDIANDLIEDNGTQVYHLAAQLFPLSK